MKMKKTKTICLLLMILLLLSGCRKRTGVSSPSEQTAALHPADTETETAESGHGNETGSHSVEDSTQSGEVLSDEMTESEQTRENPESRRREYDETADVEIRDGQAKRLQDAGDGEGFFEYAADALGAVSRADEHAERTATRTSWVEQSDRLSASETGELSESALRYYTVLLAERTSSLFECKKLYAYLEMPENYVTIHKTSGMHACLINAGLYDVAARLRENDLMVDDGWVIRKNPDMIVKVVDPSVLGHSVQVASLAGQVYDSLLSRPEWDSIAAVQKRRVVLISSELLDNPYLQCAGMLFLAKSAYPELFEDVDLSEAAAMLIDEVGGSAFTGTYFYDAQGGISI